jgi:hypothetical protein
MVLHLLKESKVSTATFSVMGMMAVPVSQRKNCMKNTYCLNQVNFITEYTNIQHVINTQISLKRFNQIN